MASRRATLAITSSRSSMPAPVPPPGPPMWASATRSGLGRSRGGGALAIARGYEMTEPPAFDWQVAPSHGPEYRELQQTFWSHSKHGSPRIEFCGTPPTTIVRMCGRRRDRSPRSLTSPSSRCHLGWPRRGTRSSPPGRPTRRRWPTSWRAGPGCAQPITAWIAMTRAATSTASRSSRGRTPGAN